jgi:hypothetical protein
MKSLIIALAASIGLMTASAAAADDFDNSAYSITATSGNLEFTLDGSVDDNITGITTGMYLFDHNLGSWDAVVFANVGYDRLNDQMRFGAEYQLARAINDFTVYGDLGAEYRAPVADLRDGDVFVEPSAGVAYGITDSISAFGEVSYEWNATDNWARNGGVAEVGVDFDVAKSMVVTPSLTRTFDTGADETQFNLGISLSF